MSRYCSRGVATLPVLALLLLVVTRPAAGQERGVPGGVRLPGSSGAREAPLVNWSEVTASDFALSSFGAIGKPFRTFSLELVDGSQHWVERSYHWQSGIPVLDGTTVQPSGVRVVYAVAGYKPAGGWYAWPVFKVGVLMPIVSGARQDARRANAPNPRVDAAALHRIPLPQAIGYRPDMAAAARAASPATCPASAEYAPKDPPLQAACVLLAPGQYVDLPNQTRILRVGNNYRVSAGASLLEDLSNVTIIRTADGRYYTLRELGHY